MRLVLPSLVEGCPDLSRLQFVIVSEDFVGFFTGFFEKVSQWFRAHFTELQFMDLLSSLRGGAKKVGRIANKSAIFTLLVPCCAQLETVNGKLFLCFILSSQLA